LAIFVLAVAGLLGIWQLWHRFGPLNSRLDSAALVTQIQALKELATVKYTVQKVVGIKEQKSPVGMETLLLVVQARVVAGVDLAELTRSHIQRQGDTVLVALPQAKILHVYLDEGETKVWDRRITWWTPWVPFNPDLERQARVEALKSSEAAAVELGILNQARQNAETAVRSLLQIAGAKDVQFRVAS
jgi:hypothetical protein